MSKSSAADDLLAILGENDDHDKIDQWIDSGFAPLNKAISGRYNGGLPGGRIVEMFGPESSGKTAIATMSMISAQRAGGLAIFRDHERSFRADHAEGLGLNLASHYSYKKPETFEESIDQVVEVIDKIRTKGAIADEAPIVVVYDSLASMIPKSKFEKIAGKDGGVASLGMHDNTALARATAACFPSLAHFANKFNTTMLFLNQIRLKPGIAYGDPTTTPGGESPKFYASVRVQIGRKKLMEQVGGEKEFSGQRITAKVIKNKVARPFKEATWDFKFREDGSGYFDVTGSTIDFCCEKGLLNKSGAFIEWTDGKKYHRKALIDKIETEAAQAELRALLKDD